MRILFVTASRIGDAVLTTGLADHLLGSYPEARITVACGAAAAEVFLRMPRRERTIVMAQRRSDLHWVELWWQTVFTRWDLAVDLRGSPLPFFLSARRRRVGRGGRRAGRRLVHLARVLGLKTPPLPVCWTAAEDHARAEALMGPGPPVIGLGPTANWAGKVWPAERFAALFRCLADGPLAGARAAVFGGPGKAERNMTAPLFAALPEAIDLVGRLSLPEAAAALSRVALFVGNDSGLMHLAAAAQAPTLGLFGPSRADEYAPAGRLTAVAVAPGPEGAAPMTALSVEAAFTAALPLLRTAAGEPP